MKKIVLLMFTFFEVMQLWATDFKVGYLYYKIIDNEAVEIISNQSYKELDSITIPETITYQERKYVVNAIGRNAFYCCTKLTYINIPNSVTSIGELAFYECSNLTSVTIPKLVTSIKLCTFEGCSRLASVIIPNSIENIGNNAFYGCSSLASVTIPNSVINIGDFAFSECAALKKVYCDFQSQPSSWSKCWKGRNNDVEVVWKNNKTKSSTTKNESAIVFTGKPPVLDIIPNSIQFIDKSDNNAIDANESCKIRFEVQNNGQGDAMGCAAKVMATSGSSKDLDFITKTLSTITAGAKQQVEVTIIAGQNVEDGTVTLSVVVEEPHGFGSNPVQLTVNTKAFEAPLVQVVDYTVTGSNGTTIAKREEFNLQVLVQNTKHGKAENVNVKIELPTNVFMLSGEQQQLFMEMNAGEQKLLSYSLIVNNNYVGTEIPIRVSLSEKYGKYAENKTINLKMNQTLASTALVISEKAQQRQQIQIGALGSDVDKDIPQTGVVNAKTFAVIIANENYQSVAEVPFARNDGDVFRQYCIKTLGIPEKNIHFTPNATLNNIKADVNWLRQVIEAYNGAARVFFYYAGHGIPDEAQKTAYLLPVDGYGTDVSTGYKLDDLYTALGNLPSQSVTVFLDACFSGANRNGEMLASARGIAIKAKSSVPVGNMVVFSAAQGDETAYPNNDQQHGMFTYYLLKKLKETKGDVTYKELGDYVSDNVRKQSIVLNGKSQTPTVVPSSSIGDVWKSWKLK